uniref:DUF4767 domain-containing protein n=1 Tax=Heterorhabditis bacteriophora TaxID=37862 RepID=A0A1I7X6S7_HETBA
MAETSWQLALLSSDRKIKYQGEAVTHSLVYVRKEISKVNEENKDWTSSVDETMDINDMFIQYSISNYDKVIFSFIRKNQYVDINANRRWRQGGTCETIDRNRQVT